MKDQIKNILNTLISKWKFYLTYLTVFSLSKIALIGVPIVLSILSNQKIYSYIEYALSWSLIIGILFKTGIEYSYSNFNLVHNDKSHNFVIYIHLFITTTIPALVILFFVDYETQIKLYLCVLLGIITAFSTLIGNNFLTKGKPSIGVIFGNLLMNTLALIVIVFYFLDDPEQNLLRMIIISFWIVYLFLALITLRFYLNSRKGNFLNSYKKVLNYGIRSMIFVLIYVWVFNSGKIFTEYFFDIENVGVFSIYYRITSIVVVLEKFIEQSSFKQLYKKELIKLDKYFSIFLVLVLVLGIIIDFVAPIFFSDFLPIMKNTIEKHLVLLPVFSISMVFWSAITLSQKIVLRSTITIRILINYIVLSVSSFIVFYILNILNILNLNLLVFIYTVILFLLTEINYYEIYKTQNYKFKFSRYVNYISLILLIFVFVLFIFKII